MNQIYRAIRTTKQNVHQRLNRDFVHLEEQEQLLDIIHKVRQDHPSMGAQALYQKLNPKGMGRDRFYNWYRSEQLRIVPQKNWRRTTDSSGVIRFRNLIENIKLTGVNQVWVSDITYYEIGDTFYYLTFIMDQYSRKIKGYQASRSLRTEETTMPALTMAMKCLSPTEKPILHSDGGGQYYSRSFLSLTHNRFNNSMGESAYENPHAERLNRTIKNSYLKYYRPDSFESLKKQLARAVEMYNVGKPHKSLKGLTPLEFERIIKTQKISV
jgi:transposase InsO family protein